MNGSRLYVACDRIPYDTKDRLITLSEEASKNLLLDRWRMTRVGCMLSYEKIDDASISDPDLKWSNKLNSIAPMISILVILLLAILFSLARCDIASSQGLFC